MKKEPILEKKIKIAKERTREWALGVNVEFPWPEMEKEEKTLDKGVE